MVGMSSVDDSQVHIYEDVYLHEKWSSFLTFAVEWVGIFSHAVSFPLHCILVHREKAAKAPWASFFTFFCFPYGGLLTFSNRDSVFYLTWHFDLPARIV